MEAVPVPNRPRGPESAASPVHRPDPDGPQPPCGTAAPHRGGLCLCRRRRLNEAWVSSLQLEGVPRQDDDCEERDCAIPRPRRPRERHVRAPQSSPHSTLEGVGALRSRPEWLAPAELSGTKTQRTPLLRTL